MCFPSFYKQNACQTNISLFHTFNTPDSMKDVSGSTGENSKKPAENSKRLAVFASRHKKRDTAVSQPLTLNLILWKTRCKITASPYPLQRNRWENLCHAPFLSFWQDFWQLDMSVWFWLMVNCCVEVKAVNIGLPRHKSHAAIETIGGFARGTWGEHHFLRTTYSRCLNAFVHQLPAIPSTARDSQQMNQACL